MPLPLPPLEPLIDSWTLVVAWILHPYEEGGQRVPRQGQTLYANKLSVAKRWREDGRGAGDDGYTWRPLPVCGPRLARQLTRDSIALTWLVILLGRTWVTSK